MVESGTITMSRFKRIKSGKSVWNFSFCCRVDIVCESTDNWPDSDFEKVSPRANINAISVSIMFIYFDETNLYQT